MTDASDSLEAIARDYWDALLRDQPTVATMLSVHDHDDRLEDLSPEARDAWISELERLGARLESIDRDALGLRERVTHELLEEALTSGVRLTRADTDAWALDQLNGPQVQCLNLVRVHPVTDDRSAETFLARVREMPRLLGQHAANLRRGLADGRVAARPSVDRVIEQLDAWLDEGPEATSIWKATIDRPEAIETERWESFAADVRQAVSDGLLPALSELRAFLGDEIAPKAREVPGLVSLPGGEALYAELIRQHCSLELPPSELHELGRSEVARVREEMQELFAEVFPGRDVPEVLAELRERTRHGFGSREEILEAARTAVERATRAAETAFALLPDHTCAVQPVDAHAEQSAPAAFYLGPAPDGSRPGTYYVNTWDPGSRPRYEAEVVAFHEAVPGHHLQIALAQQIEGVPDFQRHSHCTAYVEGWALYTERLADELGLYSGPLDRVGMLSCDAWRGSRLVVDTGLHALGWSRQQAIDHLVENTAASLPDIEVEIDRYITWPGQALSYKVGQVEIRRLRREAEERLGEGFDLPGFHRAVLEHGGVTLPVLRRLVERWVDETAGRAERA